MTDRVQEMLDVVKQELETPVKRSRRRKAKAGMRADVREGILKNPHQSQGTGPASLKSGSSGFREGQAGYSEPRHPDVWRDGSAAGGDTVAPSRGGLKIDPAEAALAAFQATKGRPAKRTSRWGILENLSFDRPRMDEQQIKPRGRGSKGRIIRRKKIADGAILDSRGEPEKGHIELEKPRGSWLRVLTGSRKRR